MKKIYIAILSFILAVSLCFATACAKGGSLELSHKEHTMLPNEVFILKVLTDVGNNDVLYTSSDESVVTVKQTGEVTAVATGTADVKVTAIGRTAVCKITVLKDDRVPTLRLTNIDKEGDEYVLPLGMNETYPIGTQVNFAGATVEGSFTFETSDADIANVNQNGVITTGQVGGEATIYVTGSYNGRFQDILVAQIIVKVSNVNWSYSIEEAVLYPAASFKGQQLKNTLEFDISLHIGEKEIDLSQMSVNVVDPTSISVEGNVITAKKAGLTYFELSYYDEETETTYTRRQNVTVSRIIDNRLDNPAYTITRLEDVSLSVFDKIAADYVDGSQTSGETQMVFDITEGRRNQITALGGSYQGLITGEKQVEIYNEAFIVKVNLHVIDYCINDATELKQVFYSATSEYIELGNDIYGVGVYKHPKPTLIFSGTIDGKGHVIDGVNFTKGAGFFGLCAGTFKNLAVVNAEIDKMSAVLTNQSVASGLVTDNVYIHVASIDSDETEGKEVSSGAVLLQIESGEVLIKNTIVEMYGVNGKNVGAIAGVWYDSRIEVENSYFITDGTLYGYILGYEGDSGWSSIDGTLGVQANKSNLDYVFVNGESFNAERIKTNSTVDLSGFDSELWDLNNNDVPRFKRDVRAADEYRLKAVETKVATVSDEETVILISLSTEDYQIKLPEISENITAMYACGLAINEFNFNTTSKVLTFDYKDVSRFAEDNNVELLLITESGNVYKATFMLAPADCVLRTAEDVSRVLSRGNGEHYICYILNDIDGAVIENLAPYDDDWADRAKIYGLGHKLTNVTIKGEGLLGQLGSGLVKDLAIHVKSFEPAFYTAAARYTASGVLGGDLTNLVLENVYFESNATKIADTCLSGVTIKNCIFNIPNSRLGKIIDTEYANHPYEDDYSGTLIIGKNNMSESQFFTTYKDGLPATFDNSMFEIKDGTLFFNGKWVLGANKPVEPEPEPEQPSNVPVVDANGQITGTLYKGEVAYLEKTSADAQKILIANSIKSVQNLLIDGNAVDFTFDSTTSEIIISATELQSISSGVKTCTFKDANDKPYTMKLTVADYVIREASEIGKLANTVGNNYIVLAANIVCDPSTQHVEPASTPGNYTGTIDGKGNVIKNYLNLGNDGMICTGVIGSEVYVFSGTIKNIAFINMDNMWGMRGFFSAIADGATVENVYVNGRSEREQLFACLVGDGVTVKDTIINFADDADYEGKVWLNKACDGNYTPVESTAEVTYEGEFWNIWNDETPFTSAAEGALFGDFEMRADGLYFNGTLIKAK